MKALPSLQRSTTVYRSRWLHVREDHYMIDGTPRIYSVVERDPSVVIVPVSPSARTLLLRQFRIPTGEHSWELPMGGIDPGEEPAQAAARELVEETGIRAEHLVSLGVYRAVPGLTPQRVHVFRAAVSDEQLAAAITHPNVDDIRERRIWSISEVMAAAAQAITDGFTLAALTIFHSRSGPASAAGE